MPSRLAFFWQSTARSPFLRRRKRRASAHGCAVPAFLKGGSVGPTPTGSSVAAGCKAGPAMAAALFSKASAPRGALLSKRSAERAVGRFTKGA